MSRKLRRGSNYCGSRALDATGKVDEALLSPAVTESALQDAKASTPSPNPAKAFETARKWLEEKVGVWDWDDDVEFIGTSWVEFRSA